MEKIEFTFVAIEKNGSGTLTRSFEFDSKKTLKECWDEFSSEANEWCGSWRYELHSEEEKLSKEVREWFDELELDIEDGFSGII